MEEDALYVTMRGASHTECVTRAEWEQYEHRRDEERGIIVREVVGRFSQFPVKPAWAITIHKSQGQSYDACSIDFGHRAFCAGQAYVALSRCRSIETLHLHRPMRVEDVRVDQRVIEFCEVVSALNAEAKPLSPETNSLGDAESTSAHDGQTPMRPRVFLSHATADREVAKFVRSILQNAEFDCWFAPADIEADPLGFSDSLAASLDSSSALLVLLSQEAQRSEWVKRELYGAVNRRIPILPVWTTVQRGSLTGGFELLLGPCQMATLGPNAVDELPRRLRELLSAPT